MTRSSLLLFAFVVAILSSSCQTSPVRTIEPGQKLPHELEASPPQYQSGQQEFIPRPKKPNPIKKAMKRMSNAINNKVQDKYIDATPDPGEDKYRFYHPEPLKKHPYDDRILPPAPTKKALKQSKTAQVSGTHISKGHESKKKVTINLDAQTLDYRTGEKGTQELDLTTKKLSYDKLYRQRVAEERKRLWAQRYRAPYE